MIENFAHALSSFIWSVTVLIIFFTLRKQLIDMLKNVSSLKFGDTTFGISRQNIPAKNPLPVISEDNIYKHEIEFAEDKVRELIKLCEEKNHNVRDALIRECAVLLVIQEFDRIYIVSFQSQLQALTLITSCPPISKNTMLEIYNEETKKYPEFYRGFAFATWLKFLKDTSLIEEEEDRYLPTDKAIAFTKYIEKYKGIPKLF